MEKNKSFFMVAMAASIVVYSACNNSETKPVDITTPVSSPTHTASMNEQPYGKIDSTQIIKYTLSNAKGMKVKILNYGGTVTNIMVPDKNGQAGDVVLGYESLDGYLQKGNPYFGALIGRYANRIGGAKFALDGKTYTLAPNDHGNTLHGGVKGFDKVVWKGTMGGDSSLTLTYDSKDGEEGFPGNLHAQVVYTVTADNELKIDYSATTDKATPVNLTNHCYFNLSAGNDSTVLNHVLMLNADKYTAANAQLIPTGQNPPVKGTPMDFTKAKKIGADLDKVKGGYDHNWVLNKKGEGMELAATIYEPTSGRYMEVWTTQPGIQFYTGNFLDGTLKDTKGGKKYVQHGSLCLETQHFPDSPNQPSFPNTILKPGETYHQVSAYKFSTK
jgi:aldose 1-epimerase